jgi:predicted DNA binding CopG/RHH family protein
MCAQHLYTHWIHKGCVYNVEAWLGREVPVNARKSGAFRAETYPYREYRTEEEFKEALKTGALPWTEIERYIEWRKAEIKDTRINLRISATDRMKLKALARMQGKKYQTYMGEILKREIHAQEDRLAGADSDVGGSGKPT